MDNCRRCGAKLNGELICANCGATAGPAATDTPPARPTSPPAPRPADQPPKHRTRTTLIIAVVLLLIALAGGAAMLISGARNQPSATTAATNAPVPSVSTSAPAASTSSAPSLQSPDEFVEHLYALWTDRNRAAIKQIVSPSFIDHFPNWLLDDQAITSVSSTNNRITDQFGDVTEVCGRQTFTKSSGSQQVESRCFHLLDENGDWYLIWTGDQNTVREWN